MVGKVAVWLCVVLLLVGCAAPAPAAPTATPGPTAEATPEPTPEPTPTAEEQPVRDWAQDVWIEGGALQENTLVSRGGTIYAYLGGEGALYAFDRETGAKSLCLHQGSAGKQNLYYLHEKDGLLYAAGLRGSGGFAWADPATGESGAAGFFPDLRIGDCAVCEGTLYITGETSEEGTPGYGVYTAALEKGPDGMERIELEAGEPLLFRAGSGEFSAVIAEEGALLLHEWRGAEGESGRVQRLVRLDIATGEETVLAESICNTWTARSAGNYLIVRQEGEELRPLLLDGSGEEREIALPETARTAESVPAGALLGLDWTSEAGERTLSLIEPETGAIARSAAVPLGWSRCLGTDGERLYFWDSAKPDETSLLVALDLETLEACTPFA